MNAVYVAWRFVCQWKSHPHNPPYSAALICRPQRAGCPCCLQESV